MEKPITNEILKFLNNITYCKAWKRLNTGMTGTTGFPDITGVIHIKSCGVRIEIEVKDAGEEPSELQLSRLREFRGLGCISFWCDNLESAKKQFWNWVEFLESGAERPSNKDLESRDSFVLGDLKK